MPKKAKTSVENAVKTSDKTAEDPTGTAAKEAQKQEKSAAHSSAKDNHAPKKEKAAAKSEKSPKRSEKHTDKESGAAAKSAEEHKMKSRHEDKEKDEKDNDIAEAAPEKPAEKHEKKERAIERRLETPAEIAARKARRAAEDAIQPSVNIGLVGHVDHGKTTLTERLSGKWTDTHSEEMKRGITIRLGYADTIFRKCPRCSGAEAFTTKERCDKCGNDTAFLRKISLVDAPGHESLMATMLSGATIMDGALLLVSANESCPQPQTKEHIVALELMGIKNVVVVQNKVDLVSKEQALKNYKEIKEFLKDSRFKDAPIIPISAKHGINIDALILTIEEVIPTPARDLSKDPIMLIARSFDVNRPGSLPKDLVGGVLGGAIVQGKLSVDDEIELRPGRKHEKENKIIYTPITTKILSIKTGGAEAKSAVPGGSIGVMTSLDPAIVKSDALVGCVVGHKGKLPPVWDKTLRLHPHLLKRVVGAKEDIEVVPIKMNEMLMLNVNSAATVGVVTGLSKDTVECTLKLAVCAEVGAKVSISRRVAERFRLIGYGVIKK